MWSEVGVDVQTRETGGLQDALARVEQAVEQEEKAQHGPALSAAAFQTLYLQGEESLVRFSALSLWLKGDFESQRGASPGCWR